MGALVSVRRGVDQALRCPLCFEGVHESRCHACTGCGTRYHAACLVELGGCSTLGCRERGAKPRPRPVDEGVPMAVQAKLLFSFLFGAFALGGMLHVRFPVAMALFLAVSTGALTALTLNLRWFYSRARAS